MRTGWRDAEADGSGPLAATSIGRGRKYFSAAICRLPDGTHLPARGTGISDADASDYMDIGSIGSLIGAKGVCPLLFYFTGKVK